MPQEALEEVIEKRVKPMVEQAMAKFLGITVPEIEFDISDRLRAPLLEYEIDIKLPFKKAKRLFKKLYLARMLKVHFGNISEVAVLLDIDRKTIHRLIKSLKIDVEEFRKEFEKSRYIKEETVSNIIKKTLETYKTSLSPIKFKTFYEHAPSLSKDIIKELPEKPLTLSEAEDEFEKRFLKKALEENEFNISRTARKIGLRFETLYRKLKELRII